MSVARSCALKVVLPVKLVHAQVPHSEGEAHCHRKGILPCLHDPWDAQPRRRDMLGRAAGLMPFQEETFGRGFETALETHLQDSEQGSLPHEASVRDQASATGARNVVLFTDGTTMHDSQTSWYMGYIAENVRRFFHPAAIDEMLSTFLPPMNCTSLNVSANPDVPHIAVRN